MRICRDNTTYSFLTLPPSPPFDLDSDFSRTFHPTLCLRPSGPPLPPAHGIEVPLIPTTRTSPPLDALHPSADKGFDPPAGSLAGDRNSGEGGNMGFVPVDDIDYGLLSCTESLGFESSDEISSLDYGSSNDSFYSSSSSSSSSSSPPSSATSSSPSSPFSWCSSSTPTKRWSEERSEKKEFPPPLTTMSENGRRNFVLRSERKDGRLEIVKMAIERPEVLYASRQNGRLTMHLVRSFPEFEEDDDVFEEEEEEEEEGEEEKETEKEEEERETGEEEEEEEEAEEERETNAANGVEEKEEEEREWKIPTAGVRRCYQYQYHVHVWGQQQRRWVTTM